MKEITCPKDKGISGEEVYEIPNEPQGYVQFRGRSKNFVPTTVFCPQCSDLYEWDSRWGEPKPKWSMNKEDYIFDMEYANDEDGNFIRCTACGHDFRKQVKQMGESKKPKKVSTKSLNFTQEWLKNIKYWQGYYVMTIEEFKRMAEIGYKSAVEMNPCARVAGVSQYILWKDFLTHYEKMNMDGIKMIGLPRHKWKNL